MELASTNNASGTIITVRLSDLVEKYGNMVYDLTKDEFNGLKVSIAENGVREPIAITKDLVILDGHHRVKASRELLMEYVPALVKDFLNELDEEDYVISTNLERRQFNNFQKAELCIKLDEIESERARQRSLSNIKIRNNNLELPTVSNDTIGKSGRTRDKIAVLSGLSPATYARAKKIIECANEDIKKRLRSGKTRIAKEYDRIISDEKRQIAINESHAINSKFSLPEQVTIYCGDFRDPLILGKIQNGSISLILLDPPYAQEYWYLYKAIPQIAFAKLKPNGHLVSLFGDTMKRRYMNILEAEGLIHNTDLSVELEGPFSHDHNLHISRKKKDLLWYYKGPELITNGLLQNLIPSKRPEKDLHEWQQPTNEYEEIISRLTFPGDVILDLMMGVGTNLKAALNVGDGRRAIGIDIDPITCEKARANIAVKPPILAN